MRAAARALRVSRPIARAVALAGWALAAGCASTPDRPGGLEFDVPPPDVADTGVALDAPPRDLPPPPPDTGAAPDVGPRDTGAAPDVQVPPRDAPTSYPSGPYGAAAGAWFEPFILPDCANTGYDFAGPEFFAARLTVVALVANWCASCRDEARAFESQIHQAYRGRGVRVLHVVVENVMGEPPTPAFCGTWASTHGLTFRVLVDLSRLLAMRYGIASYPVTFIVDDRAVIRWRGDGPAQGVAAVRAQLEALLGP